MSKAPGLARGGWLIQDEPNSTRTPIFAAVLKVGGRAKAVLVSSNPRLCSAMADFAAIAEVRPSFHPADRLVYQRELVARVMSPVLAPVELLAQFEKLKSRVIEVLFDSAPGMTAAVIDDAHRITALEIAIAREFLNTDRRDLFDDLVGFDLEGPAPTGVSTNTHIKRRSRLLSEALDPDVENFGRIVVHLSQPEEILLAA
jgi:hypothetical protein